MCKRNSPDKTEASTVCVRETPPEKNEPTMGCVREIPTNKKKINQHGMCKRNSQDNN